MIYETQTHAVHIETHPNGKRKYIGHYAKEDAFLYSESFYNEQGKISAALLHREMDTRIVSR